MFMGYQFGIVQKQAYQAKWLGKIAAVFNKDGKCLVSLAHFPSPIYQNKSFHL